MIEFGLTLRQAREAKGLSIAKIAEKTHMMSSIVEDLENERFTKIVAPIYGRGFVKLYCNAVGLDPKPMIEEFMAIYSGRRQPMIKERGSAPVIASAPITPAPAPTSEPIPAPAPEPIAPAPEPIAPAPIQEAPAPEESSFSYQDDFFEAPKTLPKPTFHAPEAPAPKEKLPNKPARFAPYAAPLKDGFDAFPEIAPVVLRWTMLTLVAGLIVWGIVAGIGALYRATSTKTSEEIVAEPQAELEIFEEKRAEADERTAVPPPVSEPLNDESAATPVQRTPLAVPSLYID